MLLNHFSMVVFQNYNTFNYNLITIMGKIVKYYHILIESNFIL